MVIDKKLPLFDKIKKDLVTGGFHINEISSASDNANLPVKTFLLFYEFPNRWEETIKLLSKAGYGGSTLISTPNYPSLLNALKEGGADYVLQGTQYMVPNSLYTHLRATDLLLAEEWKDKIIKFDEVLTDSNTSAYIEKLKRLATA